MDLQSDPAGGFLQSGIIHFLLLSVSDFKLMVDLDPNFTKSFVTPPPPQFCYVGIGSNFNFQDLMHFQRQRLLCVIVIIVKCILPNIRKSESTFQ